MASPGYGHVAPTRPSQFLRGPWCPHCPYIILRLERQCVFVEGTPSQDPTWLLPLYRHLKPFFPCLFVHWGRPKTAAAEVKGLCSSPRKLTTWGSDSRTLPITWNMSPDYRSGPFASDLSSCTREFPAENPQIIVNTILVVLNSSTSICKGLEERYSKRKEGFRICVHVSMLMSCVVLVPRRFPLPGRQQ